MKTTDCLAESTRLLPTGNKRKARDCLTTFSETLVFLFCSIGNKQAEIFVRRGAEEGTPVGKIKSLANGPVSGKAKMRPWRRQGRLSL